MQPRYQTPVSVKAPDGAHIQYSGSPNPVRRRGLGGQALTHHNSGGRLHHSPENDACSSPQATRVLFSSKHALRLPRFHHHHFTKFSQSLLGERFQFCPRRIFSTFFDARHSLDLHRPIRCFFLSSSLRSGSGVDRHHSAGWLPFLLLLSLFSAPTLGFALLQQKSSPVDVHQQDALLQEVHDITTGASLSTHCTGPPQYFMAHVSLQDVLATPKFAELQKKAELMAQILLGSGIMDTAPMKWALDFLAEEEKELVLETRVVLRVNQKLTTISSDDTGIPLLRNIPLHDQPWNVDFTRTKVWPEDRFQDPPQNSETETRTIREVHEDRPFRSLSLPNDGNGRSVSGGELNLAASSTTSSGVPGSNFESFSGQHNDGGGGRNPTKHPETDDPTSDFEESYQKDEGESFKSSLRANFRDIVARKKRSVDFSITEGIGRWTYPYYQCESKRWVVALAVPSALMKTRSGRQNQDGLFVVDVNLSGLDINQCDRPLSTPSLSPFDFSESEIEPYDDRNGSSDARNSTFSAAGLWPGLDNIPDDSFYDTSDDRALEQELKSQFNAERQIGFFGTHKCPNTSVCVPRSGHGWKRGGYRCHCRRRHFVPATPDQPFFDGLLVEAAFTNSSSRGAATGRSSEALNVTSLQCLRCSPGCDSCNSTAPCLASYNWPFRIALLTISMSCIVLTLALMVAVCRLQSVQVFKMASPIFLCICLIGCIIMYSEMAAIFPELDMPSCVATKWTRHMGFCITFSSLLMKTWRVSLTYRVKSAHKLKLTDNQLLHWLTPILLIMVIYLGAWTISDPPQGIVIRDNYDLKFKQCTYNWWDHSLALGEMLFLAWGVKVCIGVRKAESFFNEARVISFAVYNITAVNVLMASIHLFLAPNAGPDLKYMFGFARTQLSTTVTIFLIFGPKFLHIARGTGDQLERGHTLTPSFSRNGLGLPGEEHAVPLDQENEELKEEIQKMAAQMEFMRIVHMEVQNRHVKPKPGGYFSEKGGLLAVCNTNSTLLGKPMSRSTAAAAAVQANKTLVESSDGSVPLVTVECNHSVGGVRTTANRKDSLARGGHMFDKNDELEMVNIRTTNASSSFPAKV